MTHNQVTWMLGNKENQIAQQRADADTLNSQTNARNADTRKEELEVEKDVNEYNKKANRNATAVSVATTVVTTIASIVAICCLFA